MEEAHFSWTQKARISLLFVFIAFLVQASLFPYHDAPPPALCLSSLTDLCYHYTNIVKAREALLSHEWFLRTAPQIVGTWFYPVYQFYSPLFYQVTGILALIFQDPFNALRCGLMLAMLVGAWYSCKLYVYLFKNSAAAILAASLYLLSPYLIQDLGTRAAFPEVFAQGLFPATLYYWFRIYDARGCSERAYFLLAGIFANSCLMVTHLITVATTTVFMFLFFILLSVQKKSWRPLLGVLLCFIATLALASWYIIPILLEQHLFVVSNLSLRNPWGYVGAVTWKDLISWHPSATPTSPFDIPFSGALGLPVVLASVYWIVRLYAWPKKIQFEQIAVLKVCLWLFLVCLLVVCSPFNFWKFLPHFSYVIQFPYRLLTDCMWLGALLFAGFVAQFSFKARALTLSVIAIAFLNLQWLPLAPKNLFVFPPNSAFLDFQYPGDYLLDASLVHFIIPDQSVTETTNDCTIQGVTLTCQLTVQKSQTIQLPLLYYPHMLSIEAGDQKLDYFPTAFNLLPSHYVLAGVHLNPGHYNLIGRWTGYPPVNLLSLLTLMIYGLAWLTWIVWRILFAKNSAAEDPSTNHS